MPRIVALRWLRGWRGGRNHVIVDLGDGGVSWLARRLLLGCAMVMMMVVTLQCDAAVHTTVVTL